MDFENYDVIVVGCGLSGSVAARELAERGKKVIILEKRDHIGGNMYDEVDENGILVQKYGPHTFHTNKKELYDYMCKYEEWEPFYLKCMAQIDGKFTPTPFNFQTIDDFYEKDKAEKLKKRIREYYGDVESKTIVELLECEDELIKEYANFLFEKDYSLYTAKQWGIKPSEIDVSVLKRVPVNFSYKDRYFEDTYQIMPKHSFTQFFINLLNHENITLKLNEDALKYIEVDTDNKLVKVNGEKWNKQIVYTGPLDQLLKYKYGVLPYRSLRFDYQMKDVKSYQPAPVVAYPQEEGYTRITEYTKIPVQEKKVTKIAVEYPLMVEEGKENEPYYPILTKENKCIAEKYYSTVNEISNISICGRLAQFKYLNMDQTLEIAIKFFGEK